MPEHPQDYCFNQLDVPGSFRHALLIAHTCHLSRSIGLKLRSSIQSMAYTNLLWCHILVVWTGTTTAKVATAATRVTTRVMRWIWTPANIRSTRHVVCTVIWRVISTSISSARRTSITQAMAAAAIHRVMTSDRSAATVSHMWPPKPLSICICIPSTATTNIII